MNFNAILNYQKIDVELVKIEKELRRSKEKEAVAELMDKINSAGECVNKLNLDADELQINADKLAASIDKYENETGEVAAHIGEIADLQEVEYYEKTLAGLSEDINRLIRELQRVGSRMDSVKENSDNIMRQALSTKEQYNAALEKYQSFKHDLQVKAWPIAEQLKNMEKEIPDNFMATYKRLRSNRKLPAFVEYKGDGSCYCGMNLPNNCLGKLKEAGDYVECPNCGRILVINK